MAASSLISDLPLLATPDAGPLASGAEAPLASFVRGAAARGEELALAAAASFGDGCAVLAVAGPPRRRGAACRPPAASDTAGDYDDRGADAYRDQLAVARKRTRPKGSEGLPRLPWEMAGLRPFLPLAHGSRLRRQEDLDELWQSVFPGIERVTTVDWRGLPPEPLPQSGRCAAEDGAADALATAAGPTSRKFIKRLADAPWPLHASRLRQRALCKWRSILFVNLEASSLGKLIFSAGAEQDAVASVLRTLDDAFAGKATGTLLRRAGGIFQYMQWTMQVQGHIEWPPSEATAYRCFNDIRCSGASPSKAASILEAFSFAAHAAGYAALQEVVASARLKGAAELMLQQRRPLAQRSPLTVQALACLEATVLQGNELDALAAGFFVYMALSGSRFSDAQGMEQFIADFTGLEAADASAGFLEGISRGTKSTPHQERMRKFLPHVAPARGVLGKAWAPRWIELRAKHGLVTSAGTPVLPAPTRQGGWAKRAVTSEEATGWLREILEKGGGRPRSYAVPRHA